MVEILINDAGGGKRRSGIRGAEDRRRGEHRGGEEQFAVHRIHQKLIAEHPPDDLLAQETLKPVVVAQVGTVVALRIPFGAFQPGVREFPCGERLGALRVQVGGLLDLLGPPLAGFYSYCKR